jgi:hypothetical protein
MVAQRIIRKLLHRGAGSAGQRVLCGRQLIEAIERTDDLGGRAGLGRAGGNGGTLSVGYHAYLTISRWVPNVAGVSTGAGVVGATPATRPRVADFSAADRV